VQAPAKIERVGDRVPAEVKAAEFTQISRLGRDLGVLGVHGCVRRTPAATTSHNILEGGRMVAVRQYHRIVQAGM
jgi:hypothetical protein